MKKVLALLLIAVLVLALGACKPGSGNSPQSSTDNIYEIEWQGLPDPDIVGAWKPVEGVGDEYVLFTPESKLRIAQGTITMEADIKYGADSAGNRSAYTEGNYLYGQWVYTIDGDTLTITYPDAREEVFKKADYTPITLEAKEDFKADEKLVGNWSNAMYYDSYRFTEDGYAVYTLEFDDGIYAYDTEIKYTYTVDGDEITLYCYKDNSGEETSETHTFTIDGTKLLLDDANDYYLDGEGSPTAPSTTAMTIVE